MIDNLKRIREPLAWVVIALVAANLVLGMVQLVLQLREAVPLFEAFQDIGTSLMNLSLVVATVALVCLCFFINPATPRARLVTVAAAWVLSVGVVLTAVCFALGMAATADPFGVVLEIIGGVLDLALKAVAAGALWVLLRGVHAGRIDTAATTVGVPAVAAEPSAEARPVADQPRTTWQREEAAGAVWRTADEAAAGAPGAARMPAPEAGQVFRDEAAGPARSHDDA